ncbi:hypothetical protein [Pelosinus baikalensis]|uniref:Uncharacterized protein n=1 Tax=Pelosinus baikalensis TaxID=2892015 RepID=A0ABS8HQR8_9FIRM|nr:hypothetical protein [Pelosinus baikalensis]MCC5465523.1 hypothetical protein [Pelosinus baikalensis]
MLKDKEYDQVEELSHGLDQLHDGKQPALQGEEVKELIKLATAVKQSYQQDELPRGLIGEMADTLSAELGAQKIKRRKNWLYNGFIGIVAAVFIAGFLQFLLPQTPNSNIAQTTDDSIEKQQIAATTDQAANLDIAESSRESTPQLVKPDHQEESSNSNSTDKKVADSLPMVIAEIIQGTESPAKEDKSNQVAALQQDAPKEIDMQRRIFMDEKTLKAEDQNHSKIATMMVIPNLEAQSIRIDNARRVVQQVYNMGSNDEIIITQKMPDESQLKSKMKMKQDAAQDTVQSAAMEPLMKKAGESMNSITVKVDKYDITIEGKKSAEELQKIADSLTVKEIKP